MKTTEKQVTLLEADMENVKNTLEKIKQFAESNGYQIIPARTERVRSGGGNMELPTNLLGGTKGLKFDSNRQKKRLRYYINRLDKEVRMHCANLFLHFLFKKVYKVVDKTPYIELSEKELKIQEARKKWKTAAKEAEKLRIAYRTEKGDFYRVKIC